MFELMEPNLSSERRTDQYINIWAFKVTFFVFVITIMLNMIFGIIIDTFSELRGRQAAKLTHMRNTCFVCGIDRFAFEAKSGQVDSERGSGFERHIIDQYVFCTPTNCCDAVCQKMAC